MQKYEKLKHVTAIISEYNPFHNGHLYQIESIKKMYPDGFIISIMSSNFTQRAEPAIISKWARAKAALLCGVDLVIELPVIWSMASAKYFAEAGVFLADSLNLVDSLSFGCECSDIDKLNRIADIIKSEEFELKLKEYLSQGRSFPRARQDSLNHFFPNETEILSGPNNILAIEYLSAISSLNSNIKALPLKRIGVEHDSKIIKNNFASASFIREKVLNCQLDDLSEFMPAESYNILCKEISKGHFASIKNIERSILSKLRSMSKQEFCKIIDIGEGLENRIHEKIQTACSIDELFYEIKTKRYVHARIRRIILSAFIDIQKDLIYYKPQYLRVLGFTERGCLLLKHIKKIKKSSSENTLPLITKANQIKKLNSKATRIFEVENRASNLYALASLKIQPCNAEYLTPIIKC